MPNFKGTKKDAALVLFICLCIDCFVFMCCLSSCKKIDANNGHQCKWINCPYKGITPDIYGKSVSAYVGNSESDAFSIDMLHLYSPAAEYDELETMLLED